MILESSARLAGFALAHAAWSVSDLPTGQLLTPFLITEEAGARELTRFESSTQVAAIKAGKHAAQERAGRVDAWAFAREGTLRTDDTQAALDTLVVEFGSRDDSEPYAIIQPYEAYAVRQRFRLMGDPTVTRGGEMLDPGELAMMRVLVAEGVGHHPAVADLWVQWRQ
ncbi:MAG TPA: hypothetical protein VGX50_06460 [Longimicrobium sp.]|jgi:hypothetical protein|nr:hypothetical protein [Longimicrobium sp.]